MFAHLRGSCIHSPNFILLFIWKRDMCFVFFFHYIGLYHAGCGNHHHHSSLVIYYRMLRRQPHILCWCILYFYYWWSRSLIHKSFIQSCDVCICVCSLPSLKNDVYLYFYIVFWYCARSIKRCFFWGIHIPYIIFKTRWLWIYKKKYDYRLYFNHTNYINIPTNKNK